MKTIIVAKSINNVIGIDNNLPWHLKDDMVFFKETTINKVVLMGRKTYESIGNKPLKNRKNILLTTEQKIFGNGLYVANNLTDAFNLFNEEIFIIGGSEIYKQTIDIVDRMLITEVNCIINGDIQFPTFDEDLWSKKLLKEHKKDENNQYDFKIYEYLRKC